MKNLLLLMLLLALTTGCVNTKNDNYNECKKISSLKEKIGCYTEKRCENIKNEDEKKECYFNATFGNFGEMCEQITSEQDSLSECYMNSAIVVVNQDYTTEELDYKLSNCNKTNDIDLCKSIHNAGRSHYIARNGDIEGGFSTCNQINNTEHKNKCLTNIYIEKCGNIRTECYINRPNYNCFEMYDCYLEAAKNTNQERFCNSIKYEFNRSEEEQKKDNLELPKNIFKECLNYITN